MNKKTNLKNKLPEKEKEKFLSFIFLKQQQIDWIIIGIICLTGYIFLKYFYPYPATMSDSGSYVLSAMNNSFSFYRPFGYSYFLRIVYSISPGIHAIFIFQMVLYFLSTSIFALTIKYFFLPNRIIIWYLLLVFLSFSPLAFFLANAVMSEMIFSVTIYLILSGFIFLIMKPTWGGFILFSIALFCCLPIRYSAVIFPFLFIPFFLMSKGFIKWFAIGCSVLIFYQFYIKTEKNMKETTGFKQFSTGFEGWQLANNALHIFPFIDIPPKSIKNKNLRKFHQFLLPYKDTILKETNNGKRVGAGFLWGTELPLKQYLFQSMQKFNRPYYKEWITLGSGLYADYGRYLILRYPFKFMKYFYIPNSADIFYPVNTGIMKQYVTIDSQKDIINWYEIPENADLNCKNDIYYTFLTKCITSSYLIIWSIIAIIGTIGIIYRKIIKFTKQEKITFWGLFTFGAVYYASTVFMSPVELRYWLPMASIQFAFCYILLNKFSEYRILKILLHNVIHKNK